MRDAYHKYFTEFKEKSSLLYSFCFYDSDTTTFKYYILLHIILKRWTSLWGRDKKKNNSNNGGINNDGTHGKKCVMKKNCLSVHQSIYPRYMLKTLRNATMSTSTEHSATHPSAPHPKPNKKNYKNTFFLMNN